MIIKEVKASNIQSLRQTGDHIRKENENSLIILASNIENQSYVVVMSSDLLSNNNLHAGEIAKGIANLMSGGGGGNNITAQAGSKNTVDFSKILNQSEDIINNQLKKSKSS